jgi:L-iditol 2-dehydrogenase
VRRRLAEYAVNHINTLYRLPDNLTFEQACMVTTAASPLWAIDLMGGYIAGETVLILGPGPIGLMACNSARRWAPSG